jgi:hypothetical protein
MNDFVTRRNYQLENHIIKYIDAVKWYLQCSARLLAGWLDMHRTSYYPSVDLWLLPEVNNTSLKHDSWAGVSSVPSETWIDPLVERNRFLSLPISLIPFLWQLSQTNPGSFFADPFIHSISMTHRPFLGTPGRESASGCVGQPLAQHHYSSPLCLPTLGLHPAVLITLFHSFEILCYASL